MRTIWAAAIVLAAGLLGAAGDGTGTGTGTGTGAGELVIDDFADGDLEAAPGLSWMVIADDLLGGAGHGSLRVEGTGESGALRLEGATGAPAPGVPVSFVGVWTAVGGDGSSRDLSAYRGIRLRARATAGSFSAGVRAGGLAMNFMAPVTLGPDWSEIEIPFAELKPLLRPGAEPPAWSAADVAWIGLSASSREAGPVGVEIDRIAFYGGPDATAAPGAPAAGGRSFATKSRLAEAAGLRRLGWETLAEDETGDGLRPGLPDATSLAWAAGDDGRVWFRIGLAAAPPERWFGVNVALDTNGDPADGANWWGSNSDFRFDRLVTAYLSEGNGYWQGAVGVASAEDVGRGAMSALSSDVLAAVDRERNALLVGVPRDALPAGRALRLIATVGSSMVNNDDLPNRGAAELTLPATAR